MITDYYQETRCELQGIYYEHLGGKYIGDGILFWKPEDGFRIEARVERHSPLPPKTVELRSLSVPRDSEYSVIRMKLSPEDFAVTRVRIEHPFFMPIGKWVSINTSGVVFFDRNPSGKISDHYAGSALYSVSGSLWLPHSIESEVRINGDTVEKSFSRKGILQEADNGFRIVGRVSDDSKSMKCNWRLPKSEWQRAHNWKWPVALGNAISTFAQQTLPLLRSEIVVGSRRRIDIRKLSNGHHLGICAPFQTDFFKVEDAVQLAQFLSRGSHKADVCNRVLRQLEEAASCGTWASREFILSATLEAILRTLYGIPYKKSFRIQQCLEQFLGEYFPDGWVDLCDRVLGARKVLRHRNAHPEWISESSGSQSREEMVKSVDAIIFLAHFYGYVILALAGFKDLEPRFPIPHEQWKPMAKWSSNLGDDSNAGTSADEA